MCRLFCEYTHQLIAHVIVLVHILQTMPLCLLATRVDMFRNILDSFLYEYDVYYEPLFSTLILEVYAR